MAELDPPIAGSAANQRLWRVAQVVQIAGFGVAIYSLLAVFNPQQRIDSQQRELEVQQRELETQKRQFERAYTNFRTLLVSNLGLAAALRCPRFPDMTVAECLRKTMEADPVFKALRPEDSDRIWELAAAIDMALQPARAEAAQLLATVPARVHAAPQRFPKPQGVAAELLEAYKGKDTPEQHAARYEAYVVDAERRRITEKLGYEIKGRIERLNKVTDWANMSGLNRALLEGPIDAASASIR